MTARLPILALCFFLGGAAFCPAPEVYREEGDEMAADAGSAKNQFDAAKSAEAAGQSKRALANYRAVVKRFPKSEFAAESQFKVGTLLEAAGDYGKAFDAYEEFLKEYPATPGFDQTVPSMFKIATLYLEGERQKLVGIPMLPSMEKAQKMFERIIAIAPFTNHAPLSQFNIGQALEKQGDMAGALASYQKLIERYPSSDVADDAQFQIGYLYLQQARRGSYDQTTAQKARMAFEDFTVRYPSSEKLAQAQENLKMLSGKTTGNAIEIARFYDKQKNYKAAVLYYGEVAKLAPDSEEGKAAQDRIEALRGLVGDDALRAGPEKAETGAGAKARRRLQAQIDTMARPDYVGPTAPVEPDEVAPERPRLRTSTSDVAPLPPVEPPLPQ